MSIARLARPELRSLAAYEAADQLDGAIRLNANEVPWSNASDRFHRPLNRYPEVRPARLRAMLAQRYGRQPEELIVTRGSSEGIDLLIRVFCRPGQDSMIVSTPTFSMYGHYARVQGARVIECPTLPGNDFALDAEALLDACDDSTRLLFICSPNNPTGNLVPTADLVRLLEARAGKSVVVVDEAYVEFAEQASVARLMDRFDNLVVLRTLSKALAHAGARCGSVLAATPVIEILNAVQAPYALSTPVVECLENAMDAERLAVADRSTKKLIAARDAMKSKIAAFTFVRRVWPSSANFFLIEVDHAVDLLAHCRNHDMLLRHFASELADCIRITIGSSDENRHLLQLFAEFEGA